MTHVTCSRCGKESQGIAGQLCPDCHPEEAAAEMATNKVELLIAWEDQTWTTEVVDIPATIDRMDYNAVHHWATANLYALTKYREAVLMVVYNEDPEEST